MSVQVINCMSGFKFGCDPELFIFDGAGEPVSAEGIIPGTKESPHPVPCGAVQHDGMAAEFNIEPATNFADFNRNILTVMKSLGEFLPKDHTLQILPSVNFSRSAFDNTSDSAKALGCQPDFNAWTGSINPPPRDMNNPFLRTASGHLHIGWGDDFDLCDAQHTVNCRDLVKQFDWFLGAYSVLMDDDPKRRSLYGRAGAYRPKPYGVEYRVLSNFWITSRERRLAIWNRMQIAIYEMKNRFIPEKVPSSENAALISFINDTRRNKEFESRYRYPIVITDSMYSRI